VAGRCGDVSDDFSESGFIEVWISDHSSIEAYGQATGEFGEFKGKDIFWGCPINRRTRQHNRAAHFYRSLRAVKVLLAALRSTLTVLAPQREGRYRLRSRSYCSFRIS
jgi:hypothetical protein